MNGWVIKRPLSIKPIYYLYWDGEGKWVDCFAEAKFYKSDACCFNEIHKRGWLHHDEVGISVAYMKMPSLSLSHLMKLGKNSFNIWDVEAWD